MVLENNIYLRINDEVIACNLLVYLNKYWNIAIKLMELRAVSRRKRLRLVSYRNTFWGVYIYGCLYDSSKDFLS